MSYYSRENYLKKIRGFYHDAEMIKVITGVRRCGKSCLMQTIAEEIKAGGHCGGWRLAGRRCIVLVF